MYRTQGVPQPGDIVFTESSGALCAGILAVCQDTEGGMVYSMVQGDVENQVRPVQTDSMVGWVDISALAGEEPILPELPEEPERPQYILTADLIPCVPYGTTFTPEQLLDGVSASPETDENGVPLAVRVKNIAAYLREHPDVLLEVEGWQNGVTAPNEDMGYDYLITFAAYTVGEDGLTEVAQLDVVLPVGDRFMMLPAEAGTVTTLYELNAALEDSNNLEIVLSTPIEITTDDTEIDLNGHTIQAANGAFVVKRGGSLTITDNGKGTDTETIEKVGVTAAEAGQLASYTNGKLTYYVTKTNVTNEAIGATTETLVKHEVTGAGMIVGGTTAVAVENGGSFTMAGGYITGCTDSAVKATGTVDSPANVTMNGGVIAGNSATNGGGIHIENGTLLFTGGIISGNDATSGGGGIYADKSTVTLYHGYITNNVGANVAEDGGGGVMCYSGCTLVIGDGISSDLQEIYITANKAGSGGGIVTCNMYQKDTGSTVTMNSGFVTGNLAAKAEGGGMAIRALSTAIITGGYITNNGKGTTESWGGGGIFGQEFSKMTILNALITDNSAGGFGGGVTGCSTGTVLIQDNEGAAVYQNQADGAHMVDATNKMDDQLAKEDPVFMQDGTYQDYFCALVSMVKGGMLGGGSENWYGSADSERVSTNSADDILTSSIRMGLNANPNDEDIGNAQKIAHVFINGNTSATHGGGILANGILVLGNNDDAFELPSSLTFHAKKALNGEFGENKLAEYRFGFKLMDENKNEISTAYNDENGLIIFQKIEFTKEGTYTFYMEELQPEYPNIIKDDALYRLDITVEKKNIIPEKGDGSALYWCYQPTAYKLSLCVGDEEKVIKGNGSVTSIQVDGHSSISDFLIDLFPYELSGWEQWGNWGKDHGLTQWGGKVEALFNNTFADKVNIEVHKKWDDGNGNKPTEHPDSVTVYLTKYGTRYESTNENDKSPVTLDKSNSWSYSWSELPGYDKNNTPIKWGVVELTVDGWKPTITIDEPDSSEGGGEEEKPSGPQPVTEPEDGKTYHIGNLDISKLLVVGDGDKTYNLPDWNDQNLSNAKYEVESDKGTFYLKQGLNYLYFNQELRWDGTPTGNYFLKKSQDFKTSFNVDNAGSLYTVIDGAKNYIGTNVNNGLTTTTDSSSVMILYTVPDSPGGGNTPGGATNDMVYTITNTASGGEYELPSTGGAGVHSNWLCGLALMALPLTIVCVRRRKNRERGKA